MTHYSYLSTAWSTETRRSSLYDHQRSGGAQPTRLLRYSNTAWRMGRLGVSFLDVIGTPVVGERSGILVPAT